MASCPPSWQVKKKLEKNIDQKDRVFLKVIFFLPKNTSKQALKISKHTVDGRHPAPVDRLFIPLFTRGLYMFIPQCRISSINSIMAISLQTLSCQKENFPVATSSSPSIAIDLQRLLSKGPEPWTWSQQGQWLGKHLSYKYGAHFTPLMGKKHTSYLMVFSAIYSGYKQLHL